MVSGGNRYILYRRRRCDNLAARWSACVGRVRDELPAPGLAEIAALGVGRVMCDAFIQNGFRLLDTVLWRDCEKDTQYEWYYVERRLYLIRSKTTGAIWNVHASNPEDALQKVLGSAGVHHWHDLKKDPKDLPLYDREYLCLVNLNTLAFPSSKQYMVLTRSQILKLVQNVYGWKEIEPFYGEQEENHD